MGDGDPLFPATLVGKGENGYFAPLGLDRRQWSNATPIRKIFRKACAAAGLEYFNPHSVRDMLSLLGERICRGPEEFKAWSQNIGHAAVLTTFTSYGQAPDHRQAEIIRSIPQRGSERASSDVEDFAHRLARLEAIAVANGMK